MYIILWIVFGGLAGWVASILTHNNKNMGIIANIVVGIIGSFLGGWIASLLGLGSFTSFSFGGFLIAVGGAVLLILIINSFNKKRH
jgi:uncharacterized membrane protein YeaQ/YmgE (transglycosylase-associated protein family)